MILDRFLLTDRVVLVTGAANGIGRAIALGAARFGAHVAICDRDAPNLAGAAAVGCCAGGHLRPDGGRPVCTSR